MTPRPRAPDEPGDSEPLGYQAPTLQTPRERAVVAPPAAAEEVSPEPFRTLAPALRFFVAFNPAIIEDTATTLVHGGLEVGAAARLGRLALDVGLGSHSIKEAETPTSMGAGFGASAGASFDVVGVADFWLRAGVRARYSQATGHFLTPDLQLRYRWLDLEAQAGPAFRRGGFEASVAVAGRWAVGDVTGPEPIGTQALRTGGPRSTFTLAGSALGLGVRANLAWRFRFAATSSWGGFLGAGAELVSPWGGNLALGAWF